MLNADVLITIEPEDLPKTEGVLRLSPAFHREALKFLFHHVFLT